MLVPVGYVRNIEQRHPGLLRRAVGLARIAAPACGHGIGPTVATTASNRQYVVARKITGDESFAAVSAQMPVAREQKRIGQAGTMREFPRSAAFDRQNRLGGNA